MKVQFKELIISLCIVFIVAIMSAILIKDYTGVYNSLVLPKYAVDKSVFGVVWPILYLLMGVSLYFILISNNENKVNAINIFIIQLLFNFFWPILFFVFELYLFSVFWLIILVLLLMITIYKFMLINKFSGLLLVPYLIWSLFALYLNYNIYILN